MGFLDFIFGNKKKNSQATNQSSNGANTNNNGYAQSNSNLSSPSQKQYSSQQNYSKLELEEAIKNLTKISYIFQSSDRLIGGRNETMKSKTFSYIGILGFLFEQEFSGNFSLLVDSDISKHYLLVKMAMQDTSHRKKTLKDLADNWSDVLQVIFNLQLDDNDTGRRLKQLKNEIENITHLFEKISGSKCRTPKNPLHSSKIPDRYEEMVKNATFNPFKITLSPQFQNSQQLPDFREVFTNELNDLYSKLSMMKDEIPHKFKVDMVSGYMFNLVESYFKNAGYVPFNTLNQMIEQVFEAVQKTGFKNTFSTLDDFKYNCYYGYLNR